MAKVNFLDTDLTVEAAEGTPFTSLCDDHSTDILLGCRDAACGTCLIEVTDGLTDLSPITDQEEILLSALAEGVDNARLACQCRVAGQGPISVRVLAS